jgi:phenylacetic acid degradation operon negative regulatory protein
MKSDSQCAGRCGFQLLFPSTFYTEGDIWALPQGPKNRLKDEDLMVEERVPTRTFVLGMVHDDGRLLADELYDAGEAGGFTVHQLRLCLARLVSEGLLEHSGRGRRAIFTLSTLGRRQLEPQPEFVQLAFAQDAGRAPWNGTWHLVTFSIEEDRRIVRNEFREQLIGLGAALSGAVYVCANDWDDHVLSLADELDINDRVTLATASTLRVGGESDPKQIAKHLWPLADVAAGWSEFVRDHRRTVDRLHRSAASSAPKELASLLAAAIGFVAAFESCMQLDPLLPPELLPVRWPGVTGRRLLIEASEAIAILKERAKVPALFGQFDQVIREACPPQNLPRLTKR